MPPTASAAADAAAAAFDVGAGCSMAEDRAPATEAERRCTLALASTRALFAACLCFCCAVLCEVSSRLKYKWIALHYLF